MTRPVHVSLIFLLVVSLFGATTVEVYQSCSDFKFSTEILKGSGDQFSELTITATGGQKPYYYLLIDNKNHLVSNDFSQNVFRQLVPGRYRCIVADKNDCTKEEFIVVK
jgi:hypothetical protein